MDITISHKNGFTIARFNHTSKLTLISVDTILAYLQPIISVANTQLVLDLEEIQFVDSSAIGSFIALVKSGAVCHSTLTIANINESVKDIFDILHLSLYFRIEKEIEDVYMAVG